MAPTRRQLVRALAGLGLTAPFARRATAAELPEGVPAGSVKATVLRYEDGDKYVVEIGTSPYTVLMISADAPERGDCFFHESSDHLRELLPRGTVVYLESDGELADKKKRLLRYTWKPRDGKKAQLIDERMIADGYARFKSRDGHTKRDSRLAKAQQTAKKEKRGFWAPGECGNPSATKPTAVPAKPTVAAELGDPGYSQGIGQARSEWEAAFGTPNPNFSTGGLEYYGTDPNNHYTVIYWHGTVWLFTYAVPDIAMTDAQDLSLAFIPPDSVFQYESYPYSYKYTRFYYSESLASRFAPAPPSDPWNGSVPGTFSVSFNFEEATGLVFEILIAPGEHV